MGSTSTIKLIKTELENTIQEAQNEFAAFLKDTSELPLLQSCIDLVNQVRGTFIIVEDKGATLLGEELGKLLNELSIQDVKDQTGKGKNISETIVQSLVFLGRYLEYLEVNANSPPELLIPEINQVRRSRGLSLLKDSHFYKFEIKKLLKPRSSFPFHFDTNNAKLLRRYRHMYQVAFLKLLKGYRTPVALQYMDRAISQIDKLASNTPIAPLFWITSAALDVLVKEQTSVGSNRKILFSRIDKQIKFLIDAGESGFNQPPPSDLIKELLFIIALCQTSTPLAEKIVKVYEMPAPGVSESELSEQMTLLTSPGTSVMQSVSQALNEEMSIVKEMVDLAALGGSDGQFDSDSLHLALNKVSDILSIVGLVSPSNVLKQQARNVNEWSGSDLPETSQLMSIADAVLYAESAVNRLQQGGGIGDSGDHVTSAARAQLHSARMVLIDESQNGIVLAKRAITAFIESETDTLHLANVNSILDLVRGGLIFLESQESVVILEHCMKFVDEKLLKGNEIVEHSVLEFLADALSSLEFYLESMLNEAKPDAALLTVANEAIRHF